MRRDTFHEKVAVFKFWALPWHTYIAQDELKSNEIRRGLAAVLFTAIGLSNVEALQATECFFLSIIREILSVG